MEAYQTLPTQYLRDADGVVVLYEITNPNSFIEVEDTWLRMIFTQFGESADARMPIVLVGSKSDLIDEFDESQSYIRKRDVGGLKTKYTQLIGPIECSSKSGDNVEKVFKEVAKGILQRQTSSKGLSSKENKPKVTPVTQPKCCS